MAAAAVDQCILENPADAGGIGSQGGLRRRWHPALNLIQVLEHPGARPVRIGAIFEQHIEEGIPEEGEAAHRLRPWDRQHCCREGIGDLVLHDLGGLPRKVRAQDHLDVGQVWEGIDRRGFQGPDAPRRDKHRRQQHEKAIANRPADEMLNHGSVPRFSKRSIAKPSSARRNWKWTASPGLSARAISGCASLNGMVIAGQPRDFTGPCESTISRSVIDSTLPVASCRVVAGEFIELLDAMGAAFSPIAPCGRSRAFSASLVPVLFIASGLFNRASTPRKLASESIKNWPEATTSWPSLSPERITVLPPASRPICTSVGSNRLASAATITRLRVPVRMIASVGTHSRGVSSPACSCSWANIPGRSRRFGFGSSTRTRVVRVSTLVCGRIAMTRPFTVSPE